MTPALGQISIYKPTYYMRSGSIVRTRYINSEDTSGDFPVTDSCERSATVMNEDYVKLSFKLLGRVVFDAFAYIWYDNQLFFLKETYRPTAKGAYYQYDIKFVSIANMFDKHLCFRYLSVPGEDVSPEPEINMNGTLDDMAAIVIDSIHGAASRLNVSQANLFYVYVLQHLTLADDTQPNTTLETFSFSGQYIPDVLTQIASKYEIEWWVSQESMTSVQLHLCKCERGDTVVLSDRYRETGDSSHPYASRGLVAPCEYAQEWSNIPQKIIPFGSDRNITRKQALQSVNGSDMYVSYGKQLRLAPNHTYTVKDREGNSVQATTDALGAFTNTAVRSGIETTKQFDNIYPRCHFRVLSVKKEGMEHPIYTITAAAIKADGESLMSYDEMVAAGLLPLQIEPNETLSIIFESGYLNGREFEVAYDIKEVENVVRWTLKIVPEEGGDDGVQLPFGNFVPREKTNLYEGDMFAIFHMIMPQAYITRAQEELAQAAYDELLAIEDTRPEIKCKTEPEFFANQRLCLGQRVAVHSELFGQIQLKPNGDIRDDSPSLFASRVTSFSHSLTKPNSVEFKLASARVEGRLADIEAAIADQTSDIRGLEQRSVNLSRRGWHDAAEMRDMLNSLAAEFLLVGVEKNQFVFTNAIECVNNDATNEFAYLHISAGTIQHTQEPYIKYANGGLWELNVTDLTTDEQGNTLDPTKAYYLYAVCPSGSTTAQAALSLTAKDSDTDYLLMGILSSVFDDATYGTKYRVFNRSNGYTQIAGGTITTEQIQDPTRSLIIDFQSNPPRIIARQDAQIVGNISFYAADGTIQSAEEFIENKLGGIGGENLIETMGELHEATGTYTGYSYHTIPFRNLNNMGSYTSFPAGKYVFSAASIEIFRSNGVPPIGIDLRIVDSTSRSYNTLGTLTTGDPKCKFELSEPKPLFLRVSWGESVQATVTIKGALLQKGEIATAYQPYVEHLTAALKGTTEVIGGLLMTNVLMLKNEDGDVTAGLSGLLGTLLSPENVLLWGGGTYAQALTHLAGGAKLPVLLTKNGIGSRIGCFSVESKDTVAVYDSTGIKRIVITTQKIADQPIPSSHVSSPMSMSRLVIANDTDKTISDDLSGTYNFTAQKDGTVKTKITVSLSANSSVNIYSGYGSPSAGAYFRNGYIKIHDNTADVDVFSQAISNFGCSSSCNNTTGTGTSDSDTATRQDVANVEIQVVKNHSYTVSIKGSAYVYKSGTNAVTSYSGGGQAGVYVDVQAFGIVYTDMCAYLCADGISLMANSSLRFDVTNNGSKLGIKAIGLPDSADAVESGFMYTQTTTINSTSQKVLCIK